MTEDIQSQEQTLIWNPSNHKAEIQPYKIQSPLKFSTKIGGQIRRNFTQIRKPCKTAGILEFSDWL